MLKNKFLYLLIFSTTLLGQEINKETLSQLEEMIMSDPATQALIVSHKGEIVLESYGEEDSREDFVTSQSIAKAFYASLFGVAIKKGLIESLDEPIKNYLSEWENDERGNITIRNLLEMKSGLYRTESWNEEMFLSRDNLAFALEVELEDKPGDIYKYNNVNTALLGPVIEEIFDASPHDVLVNEILNPIGISEYGLWKDHTLRDVTFHGIDMTPRDFIKFGELITARKYADTAGNTTRALAAGGEGPSANLNSIEFVTIATDGNGTDFGDISSATATGKSGVVSSATRGIFAGFYPVSGGDKRMDFVSITSAGSAQDFGDLTTAAYYTGGCSDSNGGLGE